MPSVKNPNTVGHNRQRARIAKARKITAKGLQMRRLPTREAKADTRRGARTGLLPTSGPNAPLSKKKQRKVEKLMAHAIRRKAEEEARREEEMKGMYVKEERKTNKKKTQETQRKEEGERKKHQTTTPCDRSGDFMCVYILADDGDRGWKQADADNAVQNKKQLKEERNAAVEALEKMDIS